MGRHCKWPSLWGRPPISILVSFRRYFSALRRRKARRRSVASMCKLPRFPDMTTIPKQYPADILPRPVLCYSTEKLASGFGGFPLIAQHRTTMAQTAIPFAGDVLDQSVLATAQGTAAFAHVIRFFNQTFAVGDAASSPGIRRARISKDIKIGASSCLLFEGGTNSGDVFGMDILPSLQPFLISPRNCSVMAVMRPTSSIARNQASTPALTKWTVLSLEAALPFQGSGKTTLGSAVIENCSPISSLVPGSRISGLPFPSGVIVLSIAPLPPPAVDTGTVTVFGATATQSFDLVSLFFTTPVITFYQNGDDSPGAFSTTDHAQFFYEPRHGPGCEIRPSVVSWTSRTDPAANDVIGQKSYQNETVQSSSQTTSRSDTIINGFIGRIGGSTAGGQNLCGDFWLGALLVWNVALTQAQRTIVADSLYRRFNIPERRSLRSAKSVTVIGDSIAMDYVTVGNYGWSKRLADQLPADVRFTNYAVPGSQVVASEGMPVYGYTEGMFPLSVARQMAYSKVAGKNVLIVLAGGNDMEHTVDYQYSIDPATDEVTIFRDSGALVNAAAGTNLLTFASVPLKLQAGAAVQNVTAPSSIPPGTIVASSTPTTVTLNTPIAAPGITAGDLIRFNSHDAAVGNRLLFLELPLDGLGAPTVPPLVTSAVYYVKQITATDKVKISATPSGAAIDIGGKFSGSFAVRQYPKTAEQIFGTPTTHGIQKIIADCHAASPNAKIYICTVLPRVGIQYDFILQDLNALIMGGGAGGYTPLDTYSLPAFSDHNVPPGNIGAGFFDSGHLNEVGSQALADYLYPIINTYLNS